jgi:putative redox protein
MQQVTARWSGEKVRFDIHSRSGHTVVADEPGILGNDEGMRPTEMLLAALGACTGINAVLLLKKFRQPFASLDVEVEGVQEDDWPRRFTVIKITFVVAWSGERDQALVDKAFDMACNRYCPVDATLTHGARIEIDQRQPSAAG